MTYLVEADHRLQPSDQTKVDTILERTHRDNEARQEAFPVGKNAIILALSHGGVFLKYSLLLSLEVEGTKLCLKARSEWSLAGASKDLLTMSHDVGRRSGEAFLFLDMIEP